MHGALARQGWTRLEPTAEWGQVVADAAAARLLARTHPPTDADVLACFAEMGDDERQVHITLHAGPGGLTASGGQARETVRDISRSHCLHVCRAAIRLYAALHRPTLPTISHLSH